MLKYQLLYLMWFMGLFSVECKVYVVDLCGGR